MDRATILHDENLILVFDLEGVLSDDDCGLFLHHSLIDTSSILALTRSYIRSADSQSRLITGACGSELVCESTLQGTVRFGR